MFCTIYTQFMSGESFVHQAAKMLFSIEVVPVMFTAISLAVLMPKTHLVKMMNNLK